MHDEFPRCVHGWLSSCPQGCEDPTERRFQMSTEVVTCNKAGPDCEGEVTGWLRPSDWSVWPKCAHHLALAVVEHERIERTYGVTSDVSPVGFDPSACGEVWDDE